MGIGDEAPHYETEDFTKGKRRSFERMERNRYAYASEDEYARDNRVPMRDVDSVALESYLFPAACPRSSSPAHLMMIPAVRRLVLEYWQGSSVLAFLAEWARCGGPMDGARVPYWIRRDDTAPSAPGASDTASSKVWSDGRQPLVAGAAAILHYVSQGANSTPRCVARTLYRCGVHDMYGSAAEDGLRRHELFSVIAFMIHATAGTVTEDGMLSGMNYSTRMAVAYIHPLCINHYTMCVRSYGRESVQENRPDVVIAAADEVRALKDPASTEDAVAFVRRLRELVVALHARTPGGHALPRQGTRVPGIFAWPVS